MSIDELKAAFPKPDQLAPADIEAKAEALGVSKTKMSFKQSVRLPCSFFLLLATRPSHLLRND